MPQELPPSRGHEHAITLKDGTYPVSVRPYRYSHLQKNEIEKLILEMLQAKIRQPSFQQPFFQSCALGEEEGWVVEVLY